MENQKMLPISARSYVMNSWSSEGVQSVSRKELMFLLETESITPDFAKYVCEYNIYLQKTQKWLVFNQVSINYDVLQSLITDQSRTEFTETR